MPLAVRAQRQRSVRVRGEPVSYCCALAHSLADGFLQHMIQHRGPISRARRRGDAERLLLPSPNRLTLMSENTCCAAGTTCCEHAKLAKLNRTTCVQARRSLQLLRN